MATVQEFEMEQRISDFVFFVKNYAKDKDGNFQVCSKRDKAVLLCVNGEVSLDFPV